MGIGANVIAAFSEDHTSRLTGVTISQLRHWDRSHFYRPSYAEENRRMPFSRIYSFKDIVSLRVLNVLRNQYSVSLQHLREVSEKLSRYAEDRWTGTKLWVLNRKVIWQEPGTSMPQEIVSAQYLVPMNLAEVVADTSERVSQLNERGNFQGVIEKSRFVSHNVPVLAGTRIPVAAIKRFSEAGYSVAQIIEEYPDLTAKDVEAALTYRPHKAA